MRDSLEELLKAFSSFKELTIIIEGLEKTYNRETRSVLDRLLVHTSGMMNCYEKFVRGSDYDPETYEILHEAILNDIKWLKTTNMTQDEISMISIKIREFTSLTVPINSTLDSNIQDRTK